MKETVKQIVVRSIGLVLATFFGGTAVGAVAGDPWMGSLIGVGSAFAVVLTTIGVAVAWKGTLELTDITNAYRAAVAKSDSEAVEDALKVTQDGNFDFDDVDFDGDDDLYDPNAKDDINQPIYDRVVFDARAQSTRPKCHVLLYWPTRNLDIGLLPGILGNTVWLVARRKIHRHFQETTIRRLFLGKWVNHAL